MEVNNQIFYHTAVDPNAELFMEAKNPLVFGKTNYNRRTLQNIINYKPEATLQTKGIKMQWLEYLEYLIEDYHQKGKTPTNWIDILQSLTYTSYNLNSRYWEKLFEEIRVQDYPELPSRYHCLYVADSENIERWHKKALDDLESEQLPIYELSLTGVVHHADGAWLEVDVVTDMEYKQTGHKYWQSKKHKDSIENIMEILFEGTATIIKKYQSWEEFVSSQK